MPKRRISNADFCHIHNHTEYSQFDGLNKIDNFVKLARSMRFPALGITDHGTIGGIHRFMDSCSSPMEDDNGKELKPIKSLPGCEFYLSKDRFANAQDHNNKQEEGRKGNRHIVLIAKDWEGYQNLCRLSDASWTDGYAYGDPRIDYDLLYKHNKGLICSSACLSSVINANLWQGRYNAAKKAASMFKDIFGEDFFLEVMYHGIEAEGAIIPDIIKLGKDIDVPIICTNDSHYGTKCQGESHEVLMCMSMSKCIKDPNRLKFPYHEFYLKSAAEMGKIFGSHPEFLLNTMTLAERVDNDDIIKMMGGMRLPKFDIPNKKSPYDYLCQLANDGMKKMGWDKSKEHVDRLKIELEDVKVARDSNDYDFSTYFLIVRDYIQYCDDNDILVGGGRGSGYGSVLLRALGICHGPDPIKYSLLWERFLGFDSKHFLSEKDFGLDLGIDYIEIKQDEVLVERKVEDDQGGVDRY